MKSGTFKCKMTAMLFNPVFTFRNKGFDWNINSQIAFFKILGSDNNPRSFAFGDTQRICIRVPFNMTYFNYWNFMALHLNLIPKKVSTSLSSQPPVLRQLPV